MVKILRKAQNGYGGNIKLCGMDVYYIFEPLAAAEMSALGAPMDMAAFICSRVLEPENQQLVKDMLADWQLYEHGWLVTTGDSGRFRNKTLFFFLCQMGNCGLHKPKALELLKYTASMLENSK